VSLRRERLRCESCGWVGVTRQGRLRAGIFAVGVIVVAGLIATELLGLTAQGDAVWAWALTILLVSFAARLLVRGDRCGACSSEVEYQRVRGRG
jgi:hypothetical protein